MPSWQWKTQSKERPAESLFHNGSLSAAGRAPELPPTLCNVSHKKGGFMSERPVEGDHPDYDPKPVSPNPDEKGEGKDDPHKAPESGDKF